MKKMSCVILSVLLVLSLIPFSYADDYSSLSDDQLKEKFDSIRLELANRGYKAENKRVLVDTKDFQIYIDGNIKIGKASSWDDKNSLIIPVVMVNNSDKVVGAYIDQVSINGWSLAGCSGCFISSIPAGKKAKDEIVIESNFLEKVDVKGMKDFIDLEFRIYISDSYYNRLFHSKPITIVNGQ